MYIYWSSPSTDHKPLELWRRKETVSEKKDEILCSVFQPDARFASLNLYIIGCPHGSMVHY